MKIDVELAGKKQVKAHFDGFTVLTDQPGDSGGDGAAPAPFDLFLASIATCAGFFVQSFCQARGISTEGIRISQVSEWDEKTHLIPEIQIRLQLPESFPEKYRSSVLAAVNGCSVKKHLVNPPKVVVAIE